MSASKTSKSKIIDALTIMSLLIGIGSGVVGFMPDSEASGGEQDTIAALQGRVDNLEDQLRYRDLVLRNLVQENHELAEEFFQALVQGTDPLVAATVTAGATTVDDLTYDDFLDMMRNHKYPLIWYYYHYHIISFTCFLFFIMFGVMSFRIHTRHE